MAGAALLAVLKPTEMGLAVLDVVVLAVPGPGREQHEQTGDDHHDGDQMLEAVLRIEAEAIVEMSVDTDDDEDDKDTEQNVHDLLHRIGPF